MRTGLVERVVVKVDPERGVPLAFTWGHIRYDVEGRPVPIREECYGPMHPAYRTVGWQVVASTRSEQVTVDLMRHGREWVLTTIYD